MVFGDETKKGDSVWGMGSFNREDDEISLLKVLKTWKIQ